MEQETYSVLNGIIESIDLNKPAWVIIQNLLIVLAFIINGLYQKGFFNNMLEKTTKEIKTHTDVSVRKLNGTATSIIQAFPAPCYMYMYIKGDNNSRDRFVLSECNKAYTDLIGAPREDIIGMTEGEIGISREDFEINYQHNILTINGIKEGYVFSEVISPIIKDKQNILKIKLSCSDGNIKGILCLVIDESSNNGNKINKLSILSNNIEKIPKK